MLPLPQATDHPGPPSRTAPRPNSLDREAGASGQAAALGSKASAACGPVWSRCLNPGWPETPEPWFPCPEGHTGQLRAGCPGRARVTPASVAASRETATGRGGRPLVRPSTWAGRGCPGSSLHRQCPRCLRPSETLYPGRRSEPLGASRRLEGTRLEGSQELPGRGAAATRLERVSEANLTLLCPVHTQIIKTGLETAGLVTRRRDPLAARGGGALGRWLSPRPPRGKRDLTHHRDFYTCSLVCNEPFSINMILTARHWQPPARLCDPGLLGTAAPKRTCRCAGHQPPGRSQDVTGGAKRGRARNRA